MTNSTDAEVSRPAVNPRVYPGPSLSYRVAGVGDEDWFFKSGRQSVRDIEAALAVVGRSLVTFTQILDFGCGCGRILTWLDALPSDTVLTGVDIDAEAIAWVQEHIPYVRAQVNEPLPPLPYPDAYFDLVYNHSVFTHIDEYFQDRWLAELRRVTKPGGLVVASVNGDHAFQQFEETHRGNGGEPAALRERRDRDGLLFIEDDEWRDGPFPDFYHSTFHAPWYVLQHWGQFFRVRAYILRGALDFQDLLLLERPSQVAGTLG